MPKQQPTIYARSHLALTLSCYVVDTVSGLASFSLVDTLSQWTCCRVVATRTRRHKGRTHLAHGDVQLKHQQEKIQTRSMWFWVGCLICDMCTCLCVCVYMCAMCIKTNTMLPTKKKKPHFPVVCCISLQCWKRWANCGSECVESVVVFNNYVFFGAIAGSKLGQYGHYPIVEVGVSSTHRRSSLNVYVWVCLIDICRIGIRWCV